MKPISTLTILFLLVLSVTAKEKDDGSSSATKPAEAAPQTTTTPTTTEEGAILVIGDSWASLSGNYAANICGSSTTRPIQNDAKSGSTAKEWAYNRLGVESIEMARYEYTHVWLSIGGNDFLNNKCDMSIADKVAANVVNVIKQVVDASHGEAAVGEVAFQKDVKILYFGYSIPSRDVCGEGRTATLFAKQGEIIFDAIRNSHYADYVTAFDISDMFVTSESSPLSDPSYFADAIHLNEEGYMRLFSGYNVLRFFDCSVVQMAQMAAAADGQLPIGILAGSAIAIVSVIVLVCFYLKKKR
jgi:lysophospholipase L1-like esterase